MMHDDFKINIVDTEEDFDGWAHVAGNISCEQCKFCAQAIEFDKTELKLKPTFPFLYRDSNHTLQSLQYARCTSSKAQYNYCRVERSSGTSGACGRSAQHFQPKT